MSEIEVVRPSTWAEWQVARYITGCPIWQGKPVVSVRRACRVTGLCRSEVERALWHLQARLVETSDMDKAG